MGDEVLAADIRRRYRLFAEHEVRGVSGLYEVLARGVAERDALLRFVAALPPEKAPAEPPLCRGASVAHLTELIEAHGDRVFDGRDVPHAPSVAVISESMARQFFGTNAVGRRFRLENDPESWMEVIGVVRDTAMADLGESLVDPQPYLFYRSFMQSGGAPSAVLARTSRDTAGLVAAMERELRRLDPTLPVVSARTMEAYLEDSLLISRVAALFLGGLGAVGVCLASIGLYAVVAFAVSRRSREIGIRMALGAQTQQVARTVTRDLAVLAGIGTGLGLAVAVVVILAVRVMAAPAPNTATTVSIYRPDVDPVALVSIAAFMGLVALAAAYVPARRAARVDPLVALRHQ